MVFCPFDFHDFLEAVFLCFAWEEDLDAVFFVVLCEDEDLLVAAEASDTHTVAARRTIPNCWNKGLIARKYHLNRKPGYTSGDAIRVHQFAYYG